MLKLITITVLAQLVGFACGTVIDHVYFSPLIHIIVAFFIAKHFNLPKPWQIVNACMPIILIFNINNPLLPLGILIVLLLVYLPTLWTKVPYYPSNTAVVEIINEILPTDEMFSFADFGSGFGGVLFDLAPRFPLGKFVGYELGIVPYLFSKIRSFFYKNVQIKFQSFWKPQWESFNFLYAFLSPEPMPQMSLHYQQLTGTRPTFIVNSFPLDIKPNNEIRGGDQVVYVYKM